MTREEIEALVVRERPGWRVMEVLEANDESGPSFEVAVERGDERRNILVHRLLAGGAYPARAAVGVDRADGGRAATGDQGVHRPQLAEAGA